MKKKKFDYLKILEIYLPAMLFFLMFICVVLQILYRRILNNPLPELYEMIILLFLWAALFSASASLRNDSMVRFSMIYDLMSDRGKTFSRIIGNILIVFSLFAVVPYTFMYFVSTNFMRTPVLGLRQDLVSYPVFLMIALLIFRLTKDLVNDFKLLSKKKFRDG